jgi:hypothetical protein
MPEGILTFGQECCILFFNKGVAGFTAIPLFFVSIWEKDSLRQRQG